MPTLLEIAEHADVPVEGVLRVLNGKPVSQAVAERVSQAMEALGSPHEGVVESMNVLEPAAPRTPKAEPSAALAAEVGAIEDAVASAREELLASFNQAAAELRASLPQGVSGAVHDALRARIKPLAQRMEELDALLEGLVGTLEEVKGDVAAVRRERLDNLKLLLESIETSWQTVDRRLGRVERMLEPQGTRPPL